MKLTSEWIAEWNPKRQEEVQDGVCRGLLLRGGPTGAKAFYYWGYVRDLSTGAMRRRRLKLGRWAIDGGGNALSLGAARERYVEVQQTKRAEVDGTAELTVSQLAETYRQDVLSHRERVDEAWEIVRVHVVEAQPDKKRPPFGQWAARTVRPAEVAALVRFAKEPRAVTVRHRRTGHEYTHRLGGPGVARVVLREVRALFAHAVETGSLEMTPAGVLRARSFGLRTTSRSRYLRDQEVKAFLDALDLTALLDGTAKPQRLSPTIRLALAFQLYVPLRSQSLIGAKWSEIDLEAARWTIPPEAGRLKMHKDDREGAEPFVVPLPATAVGILRQLKALAGKSPWVLASPVEPTSRKKEPKHVEPKALVRALSRLQAGDRLALGAKLTVHDLRRTWRTFAMNLGVDHVVAERSLGHVAALRAAGFGGAADVYGRAQMVEQRASAAELVASAFDRIRLGAAATVVPMAEKRRAGTGR